MTVSPKFLPGIHGLRALAALSIVLFHQSYALTTPAFASVVQHYFGLGVTLFFVLSAFALSHATYGRMSEPNWVRDYAVRRYFRIAPLFYVDIVFFLALFYILA